MLVIGHWGSSGEFEHFQDFFMQRGCAVQETQFVCSSVCNGLQGDFKHANHKEDFLCERILYSKTKGWTDFFLMLNVLEAKMSQYDFLEDIMSEKKTVNFIDLKHLQREEVTILETKPVFLVTKDEMLDAMVTVSVTILSEMSNDPLSFPALQYGLSICTCKQSFRISDPLGLTFWVVTCKRFYCIEDCRL